MFEGLGIVNCQDHCTCPIALHHWTLNEKPVNCQKDFKDNHWIADGTWSTWVTRWRCLIQFVVLAESIFRQLRTALGNSCCSSRSSPLSIVIGKKCCKIKFSGGRIQGFSSMSQLELCEWLHFLENPLLQNPNSVCVIV